LGDAVHIREVGWYLVHSPSVGHPRPRWWNGTSWLWGPDRFEHSVAIVDETRGTERLYLADER
jgi:hypothetical protein